MLAISLCYGMRVLISYVHLIGIKYNIIYDNGHSLEIYSVCSVITNAIFTYVISHYTTNSQKVKHIVGTYLKYDTTLRFQKMITSVK